MHQAALFRVLVAMTNGLAQQLSACMRNGEASVINTNEYVGSGTGQGYVRGPTTEVRPS